MENGANAPFSILFSISEASKDAIMEQRVKSRGSSLPQFSLINFCPAKPRFILYCTVSQFSYTPLFQGPHFLTKLLESTNSTFSMIIYLLTFYLFDDIKKYQNHSCKLFCYIKGNFDKNASAT